MNFNPKKPYLYAMLTLCGAISLSVLFFFVIYRYQGFGSALSELISILSPFMYGAIFAYLLKPSVNFFARLFGRILPKRLHCTITTLSILISFLIAFFSIYAMVALVLPDVMVSISVVRTTTPEKVNEILAWLREYFANEPIIVSYINEAYSTISLSIDTWIKTIMLPYLTDIVSGVGLGVVTAVSAFTDVFVGLFVAVYLLASRKKFSEQAKLALYGIARKDWADTILYEIRYADRMFGGFINGKIIDSIIVGIITYIVCIVVGFPNPSLISIIIGITNIIPFFGPFIGAVPATILVFINEPIKAIWFIMFIIILQQLDGNVIGPKILGDTTGLSSFWVLFSILFFGGLWGFVGMIIAVPLFAVLYDIARKLICKGLARNGCNNMLLEYNQTFGAHLCTDGSGVVCAQVQDSQTAASIDADSENAQTAPSDDAQ